jgi:transcriptional regulator with XRE-family HTH domain
MNQLFSQRLKLARTRAGCSQDKLVEAMNFIVSKNAISKYEKGQMMPDSKVLIALANALDVKTDFFFRQSQVNFPEVKFRKHSKLGQREIDRLKSTSTDILERYLEIESMLEFENKFKNPIANYLCSTEEDAREVAMKLRKSWKLGMNPIPNVIEMLESREVKIIEFEAPQEFDGLSTWVGDIPLIVLNKSFDELRKRFTTLHELGHLVLKIDRNKIYAKS